MFERIEPRETAADSCARAIRTLIVSGQLEAGDRLPPERALAEKLGVTRVTLRSALAGLAATGLVRAKQGSGYTVQDYRQAGGPDLIGAVAQLADERGELLEVATDLFLLRRHLARAVLERIAGTDDCDVELVVRAVDRFAAVVDSGAGPDDIAVADMEVLHSLLTITGSRVLGLCFNPVLTAVREIATLRETIYREPATNVAGYRLFVAWLETRQADHIDTLVEELERRDARSLELIATRARRGRRKRRT
jgi:GntR family transcriptional repressor for pyruvate dehydrogenase complex